MGRSDPTLMARKGLQKWAHGSSGIENGSIYLPFTGLVGKYKGYIRGTLLKAHFQGPWNYPLKSRCVGLDVDVRRLASGSDPRLEMLGNAREVFAISSDPKP